VTGIFLTAAAGGSNSSVLTADSELTWTRKAAVIDRAVMMG